MHYLHLLQIVATCALVCIISPFLHTGVNAAVISKPPDVRPSALAQYKMIIEIMQNNKNWLPVILEKIKHEQMLRLKSIKQCDTNCLIAIDDRNGLFAKAIGSLPYLVRKPRDSNEDDDMVHDDFDPDTESEIILPSPTSLTPSKFRSEPIPKPTTSPKSVLLVEHSQETETKTPDPIQRSTTSPTDGSTTTGIVNRYDNISANSSVLPSNNITGNDVTLNTTDPQITTVIHNVEESENISHQWIRIQNPDSDEINQLKPTPCLHNDYCYKSICRRIAIINMDVCFCSFGYMGNRCDQLDIAAYLELREQKVEKYQLTSGAQAISEYLILSTYSV